MGSYALKRLQAADAKRKAEEEKKNETVTAIDAATSETLKSNMQAKKDAAETAKIDQSGLKKKSVQYKKEREEFSDVADFPSEAEIRADVARKQLEMYKNSDEKRRNDEKRLQDKYAQQLLYGITDSSEVLYDEDPREKELQAEADYWDGKVKQEADEKLFASNMQEIQNLSGAERTAFEIYANNRTFVDPENLEAFKKLKERYGDKLQDLKATYQRNKDEQAARTMAEKTAAKVEQGGFLANIGRNILSLGANLAGGVTGAAGRINELFNGTGPYETAAKYTAGDILGVYGQTVQDKTAEQILGGQEMNLGDGISGRELGALAYQGGMGALESVARLVAAGGNPFVAAGLAASQTFSSTVQEATEKGATPQQAYALAVTNAGIEALTEKLPFDNLMNIVKGGANPKVIVNLLLQAGVEIGEEEASLIGTTLAEAAILREKSDYQQTIGKATAMGVPYEQAVAEADRALLEEAKQTALVSGFSGFLSAGGAEYANSRFAGTSTERQQTAQQPRTTQQEQAPNQTEQAAQPVQAAPAAEEAVDFVAETARQQAQMVPPEVKEPMPEGLQHFDIAAAIANGMDPKPLTPQERGLRYRASRVNTAILDMVDRVRNGLAKGSEKVPLGKVSDSNAAQIQRETGIDTRGYDVAIEARQIEHILKDHGENGTSNRSMANPEDIARIEYALNNPDRITKSEPTKAYVTNKNGKMKPADTVLYETRLEDGSYYVVQAVPETKKKTLYVLTAFIGKSDYRNEAPRITNVNGPSATPEAESTVTPREATQSTDANYPSATPNGESVGASTNIVPEIISEVNRNPTPESDYYDEFESWGRDPIREGVENPMADRSYSGVGKRSVKAYMHENPAVKPFYQEQAAWLLSELADSTKGERTYNEQIHYESGGEQGWSGTKRHTSESIAELLDQDGMTYDQIERGLYAIINDSGQENNAVSKRIEFIINDRLMNGYTDFYTGKKVPGNAEYLALLRNQQGASSVDTQMGASNQSPEGGQIKGTGAAERGFSQKPAYNATLSEDNAQVDRRDDVRPMELPQQDMNGGNVSAVTGNVYGSRITPDDFASLMEEPAARGDFSYAKITNDQATKRATETIASAGTWENAYDNWKQSVSSGNAGAEMSARGALFLNHAAQQGDKRLWLETLHYMQKLGTNTAQGLQAFRIIRTLHPADKIEFVRMSVDKMAAEIKEKHGVDLEIDQTLIDEFKHADTDEARDAVLEDIQQNVADQIPSTFLDKWTALRYMNMLGNLKTNVRNIAGNVGSAAVYRVKDTIATGMEAIVNRVNGGGTERTKSLTVRKSLLDACKEDFNQFKETVSSGGKYGERMSASGQFEQGVQDKRRIFKNSALEAYRKGTNWMMNNGVFGDEAFGRAAYSRALAGYLQANGVTGSDLSKVDGTLLDRARAYAVKEAQEATFHDNSTLAQIVSKVQKDTGIVGQGIMPFTKTPANVLTRAEEFSPLGLINSTVKSIQKARGNEDISGADVINSWAKSITGVGLFALGAAMMDQGLLTGGPDEDEEKAEFDELVGKQNYAIQFPDGTNYTIDWLTPAAMPMFMGAQFWKMISSDRDLTFADMEQVFTSIADPMIQMSMLQGLNDSLDSIKYSDNNLGQFFINAAVSYLTQGLTNTLMGQFERSTEENRQTTYIDKDSWMPTWMQQQLGKASQKVPGWDFQQTDYINAKGQTEAQRTDAFGWIYNMASPGYADTVQSDKVSEELYRLHDAGVEGNVFPQNPDKTITWTDKTGTVHKDYNLTPEEYQTMATTQGQTAERIKGEIIQSTAYKAMTDQQKADVMDTIDRYAGEAGKAAALKDYDGMENWMKDITPENAVQTFIRKSVDSSMTGAFSDVVDDWSRGTDTTQSVEALDAAYQNYQAMGSAERKAFYEDASGRVKYFIDSKKDGMSTETFTEMYRQYRDIDGKDLSVKDKAQEWSYALEKAVDAGTITEKQKDTMKGNMYYTYNFAAETEKFDEMIETGVPTDVADMVIYTINNVQGTGKDGKVQEIDKRGAIANLEGIDDATKDAIMHAYMTDYDPNAETAQTTELKYDYIRDVMGMSAEEYVDAYRINLDGGKWKTQARKISQEIGCSYDAAYELVLVFEGRKNDQLINWYNRK